MKRAKRLLNIPHYPFARWAAHVETSRRRGMDMIRLDIGNPDMPPPGEVVEALYQSARQPDRHGYPSHRGLPVLRQAIAGYYKRRFDVVLDPVPRPCRSSVPRRASSTWPWPALIPATIQALSTKPALPESPPWVTMAV